MDTKFDFKDGAGQEHLVYVRRVATRSLPAEIRDQLPGIEAIYAVHDTEGERLALVRERSQAFVLARQNEMTPVSVH